ncbi:long-chain fatty acid transport protein 4 [Trichinella spiralis]|uniref:long-chain fatty acid transport protein 4 n=1 Tax=Trichinella spiralis TaxID=6334 RepID=UPI0001EFD2F2|nr:long-chain fatty acid transport protein 4 [Trichinella spiralis]
MAGSEDQSHNHPWCILSDHWVEMWKKHFHPITHLSSQHKVRKPELVKEGFNPVSCISDHLYVLNHEKDAYEVLDALKYQDIIEGRMNI